MVSKSCKMEIVYRNAVIADLSFLVESRLDFIGITRDDSDFEFIKNNISRYFQQSIEEKSCDIILAEHNGFIVGTGIVFYYNSVPSTFNPLGKNAYITSMYVSEEYRRWGIGTVVLDKLVSLAKDRGYSVLFLQASDMGKPLYEKYGFSDSKAGMFLKLE